MQASELIAVGRISGTYGYAGVVKVIPLTDFPERFNKLSQVILGQQNRRDVFEVESVKPYKDFYLFKFKDIEDRETARQYHNAVLQIEEHELYPLPEGYYYHFQLKGLAVYDIEKGLLGDLIDIIETGANDVYVVKSEKYGEILLPAIKDVIVDVNLEEKRMNVALLPGLISD